MVSLFAKKVYQIVKKIPRGKVLTYKDVAGMIGQSQSSRAVGNALNKNPDPLKVPCHRVIRSDGQVGGYASGSKKKIEILRKEGVKIEKGKVNLNNFWVHLLFKK